MMMMMLLMARPSKREYRYFNHIYLFPFFTYFQYFELPKLIFVLSILNLKYFFKTIFYSFRLCRPSFNLQTQIYWSIPKLKRINEQIFNWIYLNVIKMVFQLFLSIIYSYSAFEGSPKSNMQNAMWSIKWYFATFNRWKPRTRATPSNDAVDSSAVHSCHHGYQLGILGNCKQNGLPTTELPYLPLQ